MPEPHMRLSMPFGYAEANEMAFLNMARRCHSPVVRNKFSIHFNTSFKL